MSNEEAKFEWDDNKESQNIKKHHISFTRASAVFNDLSRVIIKDEKHSKLEERFFCIGEVGHEIITVRFTHRKKTIRIIGAGRWREGRRIYEEAKKQKPGS